jgi:hypothetical protein
MAQNRHFPTKEGPGAGDFTCQAVGKYPNYW